MAAGAQGQPVVGMTIPATQGVAGYVFSTGESIAMTDPVHDPRFGREVAEQTGYVPRSILAVPLEDGIRTIGVLEVFDKRAGPFTMQDIEIASLFARQAATAIKVAARTREVRSILADALRADMPGDGVVASGAGAGPATAPPTGGAVTELVSVATRERSGDDRFWAFVDAIAAMRHATAADRDLAIDLLTVIAPPPRTDPARRAEGTGPSPPVSEESLPAWSEPFTAGRRPDLGRDGPFAGTSLPLDWRDADGDGVTVAIIDSGVDGDHPAVGGRLVRSLRVELTDDDGDVIEDPERAATFSVTGRRARESSTRSRRPPTSSRSGCSVPTTRARDGHSRTPSTGSWNSGSRSRTSASHRAARRSTGRSTISSTRPISPTACSSARRATCPGQESYPSLFSSVVSVAAHDIPDPTTYFYNPRPPVEFGAWGVAVPVAWSERRFDRGDRQQLRGARTSRASLRGCARPTPTRRRSRRRRCWRSARRLPMRDGRPVPSNQPAVSVLPSRASIAAMCSTDSGTGRPPRSRTGRGPNRSTATSRGSSPGIAAVSRCSRWNDVRPTLVARVSTVTVSP